MFGDVIDPNLPPRAAGKRPAESNDTAAASRPPAKKSRPHASINPQTRPGIRGPAQRDTLNESRGEGGAAHHSTTGRTLPQSTTESQHQPGRIDRRPGNPLPNLASAPGQGSRQGLDEVLDVIKDLLPDFQIAMRDATRRIWADLTKEKVIPALDSSSPRFADFVTLLSPNSVMSDRRISEFVQGVAKDCSPSFRHGKEATSGRIDNEGNEEVRPTSVSSVDGGQGEEVANNEGGEVERDMTRQRINGRQAPEDHGSTDMRRTLSALAAARDTSRMILDQPGGAARSLPAELFPKPINPPQPPRMPTLNPSLKEASKALRTQLAHAQGDELRIFFYSVGYLASRLGPVASVEIRARCLQSILEEHAACTSTLQIFESQYKGGRSRGFTDKWNVDHAFYGRWTTFLEEHKDTFVKAQRKKRTSSRNSGKDRSDSDSSDSENESSYASS